MKNRKILMVALLLFIIITPVLLIIVFKKPNLKVIFMSDNKIIETINIKKGNLVKRPLDPTKDDYEFIDWYLNDQVYNFNKKVNKNITLIAKWRIKTDEDITVSFDSNGGNDIDKIKVKIGDKITKPDEPTKSEYTFIEWQLNDVAFDFNTKITENITLVAKWNENTYTVSFNSNGGSYIASQNIKANNIVIKPSNPIKNGYTFVEWQLNGIKYDFNSEVTQDITLVAKWNKNETSIIYNVSFDSNGGNSIDSQKIRENGNVTKPSNPIKDGYTFVEWQLNGIKYDFNSKVTKDITLIAKWNKNENSDSNNIENNTEPNQNDTNDDE